MAWQNAFELLLLSVVRTVRLVVPSMRARGGGAILVGTSSTVKEPFPNLALSNVMRAGVTALVKTLSLELAPDGIRVNSLLPGRIATDRLTYLDEANAKKAGITAEEQRAARDGDDSRRDATATRTNSAAPARSCCRTPRPTSPAPRCRSTAG